MLAGGEQSSGAGTCSPAIALRDVVKRFGSIVAVDGLNLEVPAGVCFGLLGPNGAGKSTTMRMLTAQALADSGEIEVLGHVLPRESKQARMEMGVVPQLDNLDGLGAAGRRAPGRAGQPALPLRSARARRFARRPAPRRSGTRGRPARVRAADVAPGDLAARHAVDRLSPAPRVPYQAARVGVRALRAEAAG
jgi:hypothetical protein